MALSFALELENYGEASDIRISKLGYNIMLPKYSPNNHLYGGLKEREKQSSVYLEVHVDNLVPKCDNYTVSARVENVFSDKEVIVEEKEGNRYIRQCPDMLLEENDKGGNIYAALSVDEIEVAPIQRIGGKGYLGLSNGARQLYPALLGGAVQYAFQDLNVENEPIGPIKYEKPTLKDIKRINASTTVFWFKWVEKVSEDYVHGDKLHEHEFKLGFKKPLIIENGETREVGLDKLELVVTLPTGCVDITPIVRIREAADEKVNCASHWQESKEKALNMKLFSEWDDFDLKNRRFLTWRIEKEADFSLIDGKDRPIPLYVQFWDKDDALSRESDLVVFGAVFGATLSCVLSLIRPSEFTFGDCVVAAVLSIIFIGHGFAYLRCRVSGWKWIRAYGGTEINKKKAWIRCAMRWPRKYNLHYLFHSLVVIFLGILIVSTPVWRTGIKNAINEYSSPPAERVPDSSNPLTPPIPNNPEK